MKNIVIDCNVFISAFIGSETCFKSLDKAFSSYKVCYSEATLKELLEVLKRPRFKQTLKTKRVETTLQLLGNWKMLIYRNYAGFLVVFKARQQAHNGLCNC